MFLFFLKLETPLAVFMWPFWKPCSYTVHYNIYIFYYTDLYNYVLSRFINHLRGIVWHADIIITVPAHNKYIILLYMSVKHYSERRWWRYRIILLLLLLFAAMLFTQKTMLVYILIHSSRISLSTIQYNSVTTCRWVCLEWGGMRGVI
jgi:hypothetical protein